MPEELSQSARDILEKYQPEKPQEGDFTIAQVMALWDISRDGAKSILRKMIEAGEIEKIEGIFFARGGRGTIYRPIPKKE